ncbi:MAG: MATE family efflux transporter [Malacoplasma sp.]
MKNRGKASSTLEPIDNGNNTFDSFDSKFKSTIKLFEHTSLIKSLSKVIFLSILVSFATGIYVFVDQIMMTRLIPLNHSFNMNEIFGTNVINEIKGYIETYKLPISVEMSSIIRTANSLSAPFIQIGMAIALLLGLGTSISFSKALGKRDKDQINNIWSNGFYTTIIAGIISSAIVILISTYMIPFQANNGSNALNLHDLIDKPTDFELQRIQEFLNKSRDLSIKYATNYTYMSIGFNAFNCMSILFVSLLNSEGKNLWPTILIIAANVFNIIFDYLLISFTSLGILGAAIATNLSWVISVVSMVIYIYVLNRKNDTFLFFNQLLKVKVNWKIVWIIFAIGAASFFRNISTSIFSFTQQSLFTSITPIITKYDSNYYLSILGAVQPIFNLFFSAIIGVIRGARTVLSYNYAKNNLKKVKQAYWISLLMSFSYAIVFFVFAGFILQEQLLWLFDIVPSNTALYNNSVEMLRIILGQLPLFTIGISGMLFFQSSGKAFNSLMVSLTNGFFIGIPFIFIFKEAALAHHNIDYFKYAPIAIMSVSGLLIFSYSTWYLFYKEGRQKSKVNLPKV